MKSRFKEWKKDWIIEEKIDPSTGHLANNYYFRRRLCGRIVLKSGLAKQLAGYRLIEKDIRNIVAWLNHIHSLMEKIDPNGFRGDDYQLSPDRDISQVIKGLFVACVTFYGKLFTKATGRRVKLERSWLVSDEMVSDHDEIMSVRHTYAAHSGDGSPEKINIIIAGKRIGVRSSFMTDYLYNVKNEDPTAFPTHGLFVVMKSLTKFSTN